MKLCSVYAWVCYSFCPFTLGKAIDSQPAMKMGQRCSSPHPPHCKVFWASQYTLIFLLLPSATVFQSLFPAPIPLSATSPSLLPRIFCSCSTSQLKFWASSFPFLNTTGRSTSTANQHCLTGSSELLCSAEKDPKIALTDLKELETDVMLHHLSYAR